MFSPNDNIIDKTTYIISINLYTYITNKLLTLGMC